MKKQSKPSDTTEKPPIIVIKSVKHTFTIEERLDIGDRAAQAYSELRGLENEFDQIKSSYKSKITEQESRINALNTSLLGGFDYREKSCVVEFVPKDRRKLFRLESDPTGPVVHEEQMTSADFQAELFSPVTPESIELFSAGDDEGILYVASINGAWRAWLNICVGTRGLLEATSDSPDFLHRFDAIEQTCKRALKWMHNTIGKESAEGFKGQIESAVAAQKERVE